MQKVGARKKFISNCSSEIRGEWLESIQYPPLRTQRETDWRQNYNHKSRCLGGKGRGGEHCGFGRTKGLISHSGLFFSECLRPFRMKIFTLAARIMRKMVTCAEHPAGEFYTLSVLQGPDFHTLIRTCPLNKGLPGSNGTGRKEESKIKGDPGRSGWAGKEWK